MHRMVWLFLLATTALAEEGGTMKVEKPDDRRIVLERDFAAPAGSVFQALTEPEKLQAWLSSPAMRLVEAEVDFRAGGAWRYLFERKSGKRLEVRGQFHQVGPGRHWTNSEGYDFSPLELEVATTLEEEAGRTTLRVVITYQTAAERDEDYDNVASSAAEAYQRLAQLLTAAE